MLLFKTRSSLQNNHLNLCELTMVILYYKKKQVLNGGMISDIQKTYWIISRSKHNRIFSSLQFKNITFTI